MKYLIKFLCRLPALGVGITTLLMFILIVDYPLLIILIGCNVFAFTVLIERQEDIYEELKNFIKEL